GAPGTVAARPARRAPRARRHPAARRSQCPRTPPDHTAWRRSPRRSIVAARDMGKLSVLNPVGYPPQVQRRPPAPRLATLDGATVYLVDCRFAHPAALLG